MWHSSDKLALWLQQKTYSIYVQVDERFKLIRPIYKARKAIILLLDYFVTGDTA
jgi:hypothetical protein